MDFKENTLATSRCIFHAPSWLLVEGKLLAWDTDLNHLPGQQTRTAEPGTQRRGGDRTLDKSLVLMPAGMSDVHLPLPGCVLRKKKTLKRARLWERWPFHWCWQLLELRRDVRRKAKAKRERETRENRKKKWGDNGVGRKAGRHHFNLDVTLAGLSDVQMLHHKQAVTLQCLQNRGFFQSLDHVMNNMFCSKHK